MGPQLVAAPADLLRGLGKWPGPGTIRVKNHMRKQCLKTSSSCRTWLQHILYFLEGSSSCNTRSPPGALLPLATRYPELAKQRAAFGALQASEAVSGQRDDVSFAGV